jgi:hypothetical protein
VITCSTDHLPAELPQFLTGSPAFLQPSHNAFKKQTLVIGQETEDLGNVTALIYRKLHKTRDRSTVNRISRISMRNETVNFATQFALHLVIYLASKEMKISLLIEKATQ